MALSPEFRPLLKEILFPVQRPGVYITAEWELFFSFCQKVGSKFQHFLTRKKTKNGRGGDFAAARLATISATRWTGNKLFLRVSSGANFKFEGLMAHPAGL